MKETDGFLMISVKLLITSKNSSPFDDFTNMQKIRMAEPPGKTLPAPKRHL
jgi:hypothetical protein